MVKLKREVDVKGGGVYSVSVCDDYFCAFVKKNKERKEANKECCLYCSFDLRGCSFRGFRIWAEGGDNWKG